MARHRLLSVAAAALATALSSLVATEPAAAAPVNGRIAVEIDGAIWTMNPDGLAQTTVTDRATGTDRNPVWSPDGAKIAFVRTDHLSSAVEVWVMNADGSQQMKLADDSDGPVWSPDSSKIAYTAYLDEGLSVIDADGSNQQVLDADGDEPSWAPDSSKIAYAIPGDGMWVTGADGSGKTSLLTGPVHGPAWSPDGSQIAYSRRSLNPFSEPSYLEVIESGGSEPLVLTDDGGFSPTWSPDSSTIAYTTFNNDTLHMSVRVVNADGSGKKRLAADGLLPSLSWSPGGTKLAFIAGSGAGEFSASVIDAAGSGRKLLAEGASSVSWGISPAVAVPTCYGRPATRLGTSASDRIDGTDGDDVIVGLGGNDIINSGDGRDLVCAGDGHDKVILGYGNDVASGGGGGSDELNGEDGNDVLIGSTGNDNLRGGAGDDGLEGGSGKDKFSGGAGYDNVSYAYHSAGVLITLDNKPNDGNSTDGGRTDNVLTDIEKINGSPGNDIMYGTNHPETFYGGSGNDKLVGAGGNDTLDGEGGVDSLYGQDGNDRLDAKLNNDVDRVINGGAGSDVAYLDARDPRPISVP